MTPGRARGPPAAQSWTTGAIPCQHGHRPAPVTRPVRRLRAGPPRLTTNTASFGLHGHPGIGYPGGYKYDSLRAVSLPALLDAFGVIPEFGRLVSALPPSSTRLHASGLPGSSDAVA